MQKQKKNIDATIVFVFDFENAVAEIYSWSYESIC